MHRFLYSIGLMSGFAGVALAQAPRLAVDCRRVEWTALRDAPLGAFRSANGRLEIRWLRGTAVFRDSGIVAGSLEGTSYRYCGFIAGRYHVLRKHDEDIFTGILLEHFTGKTQRGGETVQFAPDLKQYFATVQPNGMDGQEWFLFSGAGDQLWTGTSNVTGRTPGVSYDVIFGTLEDPHFTLAGQLQATLKCGRRTVVVALTNRASRWAWTPDATCPAPR